MLFFFDESFRESLPYPERTLGVLCGISIPERQFSRVATDIDELKTKHMGKT
jgi:hypothetical protein